MRNFSEFRSQSSEFWAKVRFVSEYLGYSRRGYNEVSIYTQREIEKAFSDNGYSVRNEEISWIEKYSQERASVLNSHFRSNLMDADSAKSLFESVICENPETPYKCKMPYNKQKGDMHQIAFFTAIVNMLAERTLRTLGSTALGFDDDPRGLIYISDKSGSIIGSTSRRFDGALPSIRNPLAVWEIKEYYYATSFGSRVADAVYESQLDGFEFQRIEAETQKHVEHILFLDAYGTWWTQGKSYLCRIVDALNSELIDEVIVGKEVITRWPELLTSIYNKYPT